jgi:hypothetical protein
MTKFESPIRIDDNLQGKEIEYLSRLLACFGGRAWLPKSYGEFPGNPQDHKLAILKAMVELFEAPDWVAYFNGEGPMPVTDPPPEPPQE